MGRALIVEGDKTSHGGTVMEGSAFSLTGGRKIAREGDKVYCPRCKRMTSIICGDQTMIVDGAPVARDGDKTSCGATLIAGQQQTYRDNGGGNVGSFASLFSPYSESEAVPVANQQEANDELEQYFEFIDASTGKPVSGLQYKIEKEGVLLLDNATLSEGKTQTFSMKEHPDELSLTAWVPLGDTA
jgi:uncharacterized Zn-binding protein involved in type VI secretion